ncbi:terminase small subunit, partial [Glaesserella parasuis]|nr:terminase small subunit [Glaesserella parasuis]
MTKKDEVKSTSKGVGKFKLTDKQQRFVEEYLIDLNATQAAIRAGYSEDT